MIKQLFVLSISSLAFFGCNLENRPNTSGSTLDNTPTENQGTLDRNETMSGRTMDNASSRTMAPDQGALEQGETEPDRNITQAIRQNLMQDGTLSVQAKNIVITTRDGIVTLRGTVGTLAEKNNIERRAKTAASGAKSINNQLVVSNGQL